MTNLPYFVEVLGVTKKTPDFIRVGEAYPVIREGRGRFGPFVVLFQDGQEVYLPANKVKPVAVTTPDMVARLADVMQHMHGAWLRTNASAGKTTDKAVLLDFGGIKKWAPKTSVEVREGVVFVSKWYAEKAQITEYKADPIDAAKLLRDAMKSGEVKRDELKKVMQQLLNDED